jgi:hypothetical protein
MALLKYKNADSSSLERGHRWLILRFYKARASFVLAPKKHKKAAAKGLVSS